MNGDDYTAFDDIQRYLLGEMDADAHRAFQARIAQEPELAKAVQSEQQLLALVRYHRRMELKRMLRDEATSHSTDHSGIRPPFWRYLLYAGPLAAMIVAAIFIFRGGNGQPDYQALFEEHIREAYVPDAARDTARLRPGYAEYLDGQWQAALARLDTSLRDTEALLLHGIAALKLNQRQASQRDLLRVAQLQDGYYSIRATWHLALLALRDQDPAQCRRYIQQVIADGQYKAQSAATLLRHL